MFMRIDKFYFSIDFIIIDIAFVTNARLQIPVIFGRPFLGTTNTITNCINGVIRLAFGNMTMKLNVFNICKQPILDTEEVHDINLIEEVCREDDIISLCISVPFEMVLVVDKNFLE